MAMERNLKPFDRKRDAAICSTLRRRRGCEVRHSTLVCRLSALDKPFLTQLTALPRVQSINRDPMVWKRAEDDDAPLSCTIPC